MPMTIEELYQWAKLHEYENHRIVLGASADGYLTENIIEVFPAHRLQPVDEIQLGTDY